MTASAPEMNDVEKAADDMAVINPVPRELTIVGVLCRVRRIRMRELMLAARVVASGIGSNLARIDLKDMTQEEIAALFLMAIPDAGEEVLDLLRALVEPVKEPSKTKAKALAEEMENPDPAVAMDVIEILVEQEARTFGELAGKARTVFSAMQKTLQVGTAKK